MTPTHHKLFVQNIRHKTWLASQAPPQYWHVVVISSMALWSPKDLANKQQTSTASTTTQLETSTHGSPRFPVQACLPKSHFSLFYQPFWSASRELCNLWSEVAVEKTKFCNKKSWPEIQKSFNSKKKWQIWLKIVANCCRACVIVTEYRNPYRVINVPLIDTQSALLNQPSNNCSFSFDQQTHLVSHEDYFDCSRYCGSREWRICAWRGR